MQYATKKKELPKLVVKKTVKKKPPPKTVVETPGYDKSVRTISDLLVTAIKHNQEIVKIHAAQIEQTLDEIKQVRTPIVNVAQPQERVERSFHMDIIRNNNGYIESVEGTVE